MKICRLISVILITSLFLGQSSFSMPFKRPLNLAKNYAAEEKNNISIYEKINPAIVSIEAEVPDGISSGAGCIINSNGKILTSRHVIDGASYIEVRTYDGAAYKGTVLPVKNDIEALALLKIEPVQKLETVKFADSSKIKVGQKVLAIGHPFGFSGTMTTGIVSRIDNIRNRIQTDAAINPGSSGGPICNAQGEVIGISQSIFNPDNNKSNIGIGFAIPSNDAMRFIRQNQ